MSNFIALDLELNQPSNKIIEVGICIGNPLNGKIVHQGHYFCDPKELVSPYITELTSITQKDVDQAGTVEDAYRAIKELSYKFGTQRHLITWGCGDQELFRTQSNHDGVPWAFGRRYIDVKTVFCAYAYANNITQKAGLGTALMRLGMEFEGRQHRAIDDAYNTFMIYKELLKRMKR